MIGALHDDARERGEPAAILTASESVIYGRFGYGVATWRLGLSIDRAYGRFARPFDRPRSDAHRGAATKPRRSCRRCTTRSGARVRAWSVGPTSGGRRCSGASTGPPTRRASSRCTTTRAATADGFVVYEIKGEWEGGSLGTPLRSSTTCRPRTRQTRDRAVAVRLRCRPRRGRDRDQLPRSTSRSGTCSPTAAAPRVDFVNDGLWLAPLDPRSLLVARRYAPFDGQIVIEVHAPDGSTRRFAVDGNDRDAQCAETEAEPDLTCRSRCSVRRSSAATGGRTTRRPNWCRSTGRASSRTRTRCSSPHRRRS